MKSYTISIHVDRPKRTRFPILETWDAALLEVTKHTAASFGTTILGLHEEVKSHFMLFAALAHRRNPEGKFITPENPEDWLYDVDSKPLPDALHRWVSGMLVEVNGRRADDHAFFSVDQKSFAAVQDWIHEIEITPPKYNMVHQNCVKFTLGALEVGGLHLPTDKVTPSVARMRRPEDISHVIKTIEPTSQLRTYAQPLLLRRAAISNFLI